MSKFLNTETLQIFENEEQFRKAYMNKAFPSIITEKCLPNNIVFLYDGQQPTITNKEIIVFDGVENKNGIWFTKWKKENKFSSKAEEKRFLELELQKKWQEIITQRNILLSESDWIVVKSLENGTDVPTNWKNYRKMLRDVTLNYTDPYKVIFPSKPQ